MSLDLCHIPIVDRSEDIQPLENCQIETVKKIEKRWKACGWNSAFVAWREHDGPKSLEVVPVDVNMALRRQSVQSRYVP